MVEGREKQSSGKEEAFRLSLESRWKPQAWPYGEAVPTALYSCMSTKIFLKYVIHIPTDDDVCI